MTFLAIFAPLRAPKTGCASEARAWALNRPPLGRRGRGARARARGADAAVGDILSHLRITVGTENRPRDLTLSAQRIPFSRGPVLITWPLGPDTHLLAHIRESLSSRKLAGDIRWVGRPGHPATQPPGRPATQPPGHLATRPPGHPPGRTTSFWSVLGMVGSGILVSGIL